MLDFPRNNGLENLNLIIDELFTVEKDFIEDLHLLAEKLPELAQKLTSTKNRTILRIYQDNLLNFLKNNGLNLIGIKRESEELNEYRLYRLLFELRKCFDNEEAIGLFSELIQSIDVINLATQGLNFSVKQRYSPNIYFIKPMQKVAHYPLLFDNLAKSLNKCPDLNNETIQLNVRLLRESAKRLILIQQETLARRSIHGKIKNKLGLGRKPEVIREILSLPKEERHRLPFYWEILLSECFPTQCKLSSPNLEINQILEYKSDFGQIVGELSTNPALGGIITLDPSKFDAKKMQKNYVRSLDVVWLGLLVSKPIDNTYTRGDKLRNFLMLAKACKEGTLGGTKKRFNALKMIEAAYTFIEKVLNDPREEKEEVLELMAILNEETGRQSQLGRWINQKSSGLSTMLAELEIRLDCNYCKQLEGKKENKIYPKPPEQPSNLSPEQQERFNEAADQLNAEIIKNNDSHLCLEENFEKNPKSSVIQNEYFLLASQNSTSFFYVAKGSDTANEVKQQTIMLSM